MKALVIVFLILIAVYMVVDLIYSIMLNKKLKKIISEYTTQQTPMVDISSVLYGVEDDYEDEDENI